MLVKYRLSYSRYSVERLVGGFRLCVSEVAGDASDAVAVVDRAPLLVNRSHQILSCVVFNRIFTLKVVAQRLNRFVACLIHYASFGFALTYCGRNEAGTKTVSREIERQTSRRCCSLNDKPDALSRKLLRSNMTAFQNSSE